MCLYASMQEKLKNKKKCLTRWQDMTGVRQGSVFMSLMTSSGAATTHKVKMADQYC